MPRIRLVLLLIGGCLLASGSFLRAQPAAWKPDKAFSVDVVLTLKGGNTHAYTLYLDGDNSRSEFSAKDSNMVQIVRSAEQKFYSVMPAQKACVEIPFGMSYSPDLVMLGAIKDAKFESMGSEVLDGVTLTKYKMTPAKGREFYYWWIDPATQAPVRVAVGNDSWTMSWKNYQAGAQEAWLFLPPAGYQVVQMPGGAAAPPGP